MADSDVLNSSKPVTYKALTKILMGILKPAHPESVTIKELRARIEELEQREYQGVWDSDRSYAKGAMVSRQGGLWVSVVNHNRSTPGQNPHCWKLAVKRGRGDDR